MSPPDASAKMKQKRETEKPLFFVLCYIQFILLLYINGIFLFI